VLWADAEKIRNACGRQQQHCEDYEETVSHAYDGLVCLGLHTLGSENVLENRSYNNEYTEDADGEPKACISVEAAHEFRSVKMECKSNQTKGDCRTESDKVSVSA
jgi:hypothetical protein